MRKIEHEDWELQINSNKLITITKLGESREYKTDVITEVKQEAEYVFLHHEDNSFTQVKFEADDFLVIDKFDVEGELIKEIGCHVFGEDL